MRNIKMTLEYCGINYRGWAKQPGFLTIEGVLSDRLEEILKEKPGLIAAGRTDAGVHAKAQVVNFFTKRSIPNEGLKKALNALLPGDIRVLKVKDAPFEFHSRFSAKKKDYQYVISKKYSVFEKGLVFYCPYNLDINIMREAARLFTGSRNFKKFSLTDKRREKINTVRNLYKLGIIAKQDKIILNFSGESFLRGMIRQIGGILLEVGRGRFNPDIIKKALKSNIPMKEKWTLLPADGLYLVKVYY
ncbi:MAG: tRNA pseudouridine(38-40) synthase TruA [bacterium]